MEQSQDISNINNTLDDNQINIIHSDLDLILEEYNSHNAPTAHPLPNQTRQINFPAINHPDSSNQNNFAQNEPDEYINNEIKLFKPNNSTINALYLNSRSDNINQISTKNETANFEINTGRFNDNSQTNYKLADLAEWSAPFEWDEIIDAANKKVFSNDNFRPNQKEIINACLSGRDIFVCMPTGGGKSLTFQLPALVMDGVTIVIMPLISLINDQVTYVNSLGVKCLFVNDKGPAELEMNYEAFFRSEDAEDRMKLLFLTPEKIAQSSRVMNIFKKLYSEGLIDRFVIDEAHCISQWGRDFRPDYMHLRMLKKDFSKVPILAITATAPNKIRQDVITQLALNQCLYFRSSYNRPNLFIEIRNKKDVTDVPAAIAKFINNKYPNETGLIYCSSKKNCEILSNKLNTNYSLSTHYYHASMPDELKTQVQEKWMKNEINIVVATIAFGMGINKHDVRFVIHFNMPKSIENYYQEIGRAGRDGNRAQVVLFYSALDIYTYHYLMAKAETNQAIVCENLRRISEMVEMCEENYECRRVTALNYFDEKFDRRECNKMCDNCTKNISKEEKDLTNEGLIILKFLNECHNQNIDVTIKQGIEYLIGTKQLSKKSFHSEFFNSLRLTTSVMKRLFRRLIIKEFIDESIRCFNEKIFTVIKRSNKGYDYSKSNRQDDRIIITFPTYNRYIPEEKQKRDENSFEDISDVNNPRKYIRKINKDIGQDVNNKNTNFDYGYCTPNQFNELMDKLKIRRREILKEENARIEHNDSSLSNIANNSLKMLKVDEIFPFFGLEELCRKLPTEENQLTSNFICGVQDNILLKYGHLFLNEIIKHVKLYEIVKSTKVREAPKKNINQNNIGKQKSYLISSSLENSQNRDTSFMNKHKMDKIPTNQIAMFNAMGEDNNGDDSIDLSKYSNLLEDRRLSSGSGSMHDYFDMNKIDADEFDLNLNFNFQETKGKEQGINNVDQMNGKKRERNSNSDNSSENKIEFKKA